MKTLFVEVIVCIFLILGLSANVVIIFPFWRLLVEMLFAASFIISFGIFTFSAAAAFAAFAIPSASLWGQWAAMCSVSCLHSKHTRSPLLAFELPSSSSSFAFSSLRSSSFSSSRSFSFSSSRSFAFTSSRSFSFTSSRSFSFTSSRFFAFCLARPNSLSLQ